MSSKKPDEANASESKEPLCPEQILDPNHVQTERAKRLIAEMEASFDMDAWDPEFDIFNRPNDIWTNAPIMGIGSG